MLPAWKSLTPGADDKLVWRIARALTARKSRPDVHEPASLTGAQLDHDLSRVGAQLGEAEASAKHEAREMPVMACRHALQRRSCVLRGVVPAIRMWASLTVNAT